MSRLPEKPGLKWYFYYSADMEFCFFYEDSAKTNPPKETDVFVVDLGKNIHLELVGRGNEAYEEAIETVGKEYIFPVNLYRTPFRIDPHFSANMPNWKRSIWHRQIRVAKMDPTQALCDLLVALRENDQDSALDWLEGLFDWVEQKESLPNIFDNRVIDIMQHIDWKHKDAH